jgi:hypothetical protein
MTRGTEIKPFDPSNGPITNETTIEEVAIDIVVNPNYERVQQLYEINKDKQLTWHLEEWEKQFQASHDLKLQEEVRLKTRNTICTSGLGYTACSKTWCL